MKNGNEAYAEISTYRSSFNKTTHQGSMTSSTIYIPTNYYWFSQLPAEADGVRQNLLSLKLVDLITNLGKYL